MWKEKSELVGILRMQAYLSGSMVRDRWILWTQAQLPQFVFCKMTSRVTSNDGWNTMTENKAFCKVHRWYFYQKRWKRKGSSISTATGFSTEKKVLSLPWWERSHVIKFPAGLGSLLWRTAPKSSSSFNWSHRTPHEVTGMGCEMGVAVEGTGALGIWATCLCNSLVTLSPVSYVSLPLDDEVLLVCPNLWLHCITFWLMAMYLVFTRDQ